MRPTFIRPASDIHLEQFTGQREEFLVQRFLPEDERDAASVLALAGDISSKPDQLLAFISYIEDRFLKVIFIPGNHETYHHNIIEWNTTMDERFAGTLKNTLWSNGGVGYEEMEDLRFIFTTLWADGGSSLHERAEVGRCLNDFRLIRIGDRRFTVPDMMELHKNMKTKLIEHLKVPFDGKTIVITHHMPSYRLCHPRFGDTINGGFASNCDEIFSSEHAPAAWIGAHSHDSMDLMLGKTRYVANPAGYYTETNRSGFNHFAPKFIEVYNLGKDQSG
jgi:hypothetical protein